MVCRAQLGILLDAQGVRREVDVVGKPRAPKRLGNASYSLRRSYFVTFCTLRRVPTFATPKLAEIARDVIIQYREKGYYYLPAYCVMPDHIHMLVIPLEPSRHLSRVIATLKNSITQGLRKNGVGVKWQWGYHDHVLRSAESTEGVANYIMMNPVRKGLIADFRDWPFSGIVDRWF